MLNANEAYRRISDSNDVPLNFGGLPDEFTNFEKAKFVVIPAPFEGTVSYSGGTAEGPSAIIEASTHMELLDIETGLSPFISGIFTADSPEDEDRDGMLERVYNDTDRALKAGKIPFVIGGEHSISIAPIRAVAANHSSFGVLQLDAHSDLRDTFGDDPSSHACVMRRAIELPQVKHLSQVGIRSVSFGELEALKLPKITTIYAYNMACDWINAALTALPEKIYVTVDIDVFDPSIIPSTGTPEPGGLNWRDVTALLKEAFRTKEVVGFDIVELAPIEGLHHPQFTAALLAHKMMSYAIYYHGSSKECR